MATFQIDWTEEVYYRAYVEAESEEEARELFDSGELWDEASVFGSEVQDSVGIEEVG